MNIKSHWNKVYSDKDPTGVSWFQVKPEISLKLIRDSGISPDHKIIDIGGGASTLVDYLLQNGFHHITVADISPQSMAHSKARLGDFSEKIRWIECDITDTLLPDQYDLWHDRAVFHFLTDRQQRARYIRLLEKNLKSHGHVIISTFSLDGPEKCSGLPVERYSVESLSKEIGDSFELKDSVMESHRTPSGAKQRFTYCRFQKRS